MLHQYLSGCFTLCFYNVELFRFNTWIRHATQRDKTGGDASWLWPASPLVPPCQCGSLSALEDAQEPPLPPPPLPTTDLWQWHRYPPPGAWGARGDRQEPPCKGRASLSQISSSRLERAKSACCKYFSSTVRLSYSFYS